MRKRTYNGWITDGQPVICYYGTDTVTDLLELSTLQNLMYAGPVAWGRPGGGAELLAKVLLWHAAGDYDVADQLCTMFAHDVVQHMGQVWELEREWVRDWILINRKFLTPSFGYPFNWIRPCLN